jgi:hypothetical protein
MIWKKKKKTKKEEKEMHAKPLLVVVNTEFVYPVQHIVCIRSL